MLKENKTNLVQIVSGDNSPAMDVRKTGRREARNMHRGNIALAVCCKRELAEPSSQQEGGNMSKTTWLWVVVCGKDKKAGRRVL